MVDSFPQIKLALRLLKEEKLVHYETSFCYDAFQFCTMVRLFLPKSITAFTGIGIGF